MGSASNLAKTLLIPAVISLTLYVLISFVIVPFFRRYHQRYSQYLPLETISAHTSSLRDRIADAVMRRFLPSSWREQAHLPDAHDNISILDEEGEIMVGMNVDPAHREALERRRSTAADDSRLSRDLEEGFMDDSEEEDEEGDRDRGRRH
ncbi:hypothetical protein P175DRAFT_0442120 [Aspergillus ochraceoroseus IBT 24754]|uniref:Uncharacterized protein n=2 Tax=Aspergillus ochraceoroseus TaxID=138278 RepID=A0A2T5LQZ2_9EURO|nr:uncharacterized protein P175DRAFT_0442120 [Aspergillus ochraceoroseus IBT 24754]KKK17926.1 hypothetical protein AOCH_003434 [Aspergillus ochraceoroseus]PTU18702.1 hypothetical protein P175DRAFT_0442120 [Aspergillus ochraceoroseus IBT 24754]